MSTEKTPMIYPAMMAVMREVEAIGKDSTNQQQGFKFRSADAVYQAMHSLLSKHGIITLPIASNPIAEDRTTKTGSILRFVQALVTIRFMAEDGSYVDSTVLSEAMDSGDKAANKVLTIAHRYAMCMTFTIPTEDMPDPDAETHRDIQPKEQPKPAKKQTAIQQLKEKLAAENITRDELLETLKWKDKLNKEAITLTEEQAKEVLDIWGYVSDDVAEWRVFKKQ